MSCAPTRTPHHGEQGPYYVQETARKLRHDSLHARPTAPRGPK